MAGLNTLHVAHRGDGSTTLRVAGELPPYPARVTAPLEHWARTTPGAVFLAERDGAGWRLVTYLQAWERMLAVAQGLLARPLSAERPVMILSGNSVEHAILGLACLHAGIPYTPVSAAYALASHDLDRLGRIAALVTPGLVFASGEAFAPALRSVTRAGAEAVDGLAALAAPPTLAVADAASRVGGDTIAKLLLTSGSTGAPKAVINTHRMLCANQAMIASRFGFVLEEPPVLVDWLPWSHTFGGNHNFNLVMFNGGTLYIDQGRPLPGQFGPTVDALREVAPTMHLTVPKAWDELAAWLRADPALNRHFHSRLRVPFYAAASLSQPLWDALERLSKEATGRVVPMFTGLGSTETAPMAMLSNGEGNRAGQIGLPMPGLEARLVPVAGKMELRLKGPSITPGLWRDPVRTAEMFDADGFFCTGDAVTWADPAQPEQGLLFDGRLAEDFKLGSGTWVSVGPLRARLIAALDPYVRDIVVTGHGRDAVAALAIPTDPAHATAPELRARIAAILDGLAKLSGSASRVTRFAFLQAPLSLDEGEVTDKGSVNQSAVLRRRAADVAALYADPPPPHVLCITLEPMVARCS